jgi:phenylacetic acid degradation operon negative regulatory protein
VSRQRNATLIADVGWLERPLSARSIVLSLLLGRRGGAAPVADLVRWCALFDITEVAARVALSRSVERGELTASSGTYRLAGRARELGREQSVALAPGRVAWDGTWRLAVVVPGARTSAERAELREAAARLHLVELREGVWGRPDNLPARWSPATSHAVVDAQCVWWTGAVTGVLPARRALSMFDMTARRDRGVVLLRGLRRATERLGRVMSDEGDALRNAFVVGAAAAQFIRRDPLLPDEFLPARWPGDELRSAYAAYRRAFGRAVQAWLDERP